MHFEHHHAYYDIMENIELFQNLGLAIYEKVQNATCLYMTGCWEVVANVTSNMSENSGKLCNAWEQMNQCRKQRGADAVATFWDSIKPEITPFSS